MSSDVKMSNPFNPSFGKRPTHFYGRQEITRTIIDAADVTNANSPWRTTLITGIRGSGKTALLSDIKYHLDNKDIISLYIVPNEAMLDDILSQLYRQLPKSALSAVPELKNISVNLGVSVELEKDKKRPHFTESFSHQIMELIDIHMKQNNHVVFLVDEAQKHTEEMRIFISVYQKLIMREYSVSMVLAGLPAVVSDILNDDVLSFLRRAKQVELENVEAIIVEHEFMKIFTTKESKLTEEVIQKAAAGTFGYPYLIQLVGYYLWEKMCGNDNITSIDDVFITSKTELFRNVHKLIYADLSNRDREFVFAMSDDENSSLIADIGVRMQKEKNFLSLYRNRLISAGIIKPAGHGVLQFCYPYMREFLQMKKQEEFSGF